MPKPSALRAVVCPILPAPTMPRVALQKSRPRIRWMPALKLPATVVMGGNDVRAAANISAHAKSAVASEHARVLLTYACRLGCGDVYVVAPRRNWQRSAPGLAAS